MKVLRISHPESGTCCFKTECFKTEGATPKLIILDIVEQEIKALIEEGSIGDSITFELGEMTEEEYENLSEFEGW